MNNSVPVISSSRPPNYEERLHVYRIQKARLPPDLFDDMILTDIRAVLNGEDHNRIREDYFQDWDNRDVQALYDELVAPPQELVQDEEALQVERRKRAVSEMVVRALYFYRHSFPTYLGEEKENEKYFADFFDGVFPIFAPESYFRDPIALANVAVDRLANLRVRGMEIESTVLSDELVAELKEAVKNEVDEMKKREERKMASAGEPNTMWLAQDRKEKIQQLTEDYIQAIVADIVQEYGDSVLYNSLWGRRRQNIEAYATIIAAETVDGKIAPDDGMDRIADYVIQLMENNSVLISRKQKGPTGIIGGFRKLIGKLFLS